MSRIKALLCKKSYLEKKIEVIFIAILGVRISRIRHLKLEWSEVRALIHKWDVVVMHLQGLVCLRVQNGHIVWV